jgi:hypothetical protein
LERGLGEAFGSFRLIAAKAQVEYFTSKPTITVGAILLLGLETKHESENGCLGGETIGNGINLGQ